MYGVDTRTNGREVKFERLSSTSVHLQALGAVVQLSAMRTLLLKFKILVGRARADATLAVGAEVNVMLFGYLSALLC